MYQGTVGRLDMLDHSECWQVRNFASLLAEALIHEVPRSGQPVEKPLHAAFRSSKTPPLQGFGLDV
jgi:hypothetical protein